MPKRKTWFWDAVLPLLGGGMMWFGIVELANHQRIKEAAFGVVFGFAVLTGAIVHTALRDRDRDSNSN